MRVNLTWAIPDLPRGRQPHVGAGRGRHRQHRVGGGTARGCGPLRLQREQHGLIGLTRTLAAEGGHGVRVNAVCPGW